MAVALSTSLVRPSTERTPHTPRANSNASRESSRLGAVPTRTPSRPEKTMEAQPWPAWLQRLRCAALKVVLDAAPLDVDGDPAQHHDRNEPPQPS